MGDHGGERCESVDRDDKNASVEVDTVSEPIRVTNLVSLINAIYMYEERIIKLILSFYKYPYKRYTVDEGTSTLRFINFDSHFATRYIFAKDNNSLFSHLNFKHIIFPDKLKHIRKHAFSGCNHLEAVNTPPELETIDTYAFYRCEKLKQLNFCNSNRLKRIGSYAFTNTPIRTVDVPNSVTSVGDFAFTECCHLDFVCLPQGLQHINNSVFKYCTTLRTVILSSQLKSIGYDAFAFCSALHFVGCMEYRPGDERLLNLPHHIQIIFDRAFWCSYQAWVPTNKRLCDLYTRTHRMHLLPKYRM